MIDQLSALLITANSMQPNAPQDFLELLDSEGVSIDLGESIENPVLFLEYLLQQYKPSVSVTQSAMNPNGSTNTQLALTGLMEQFAAMPDGQELPSNGNRIPFVEMAGSDSKLMSLSVLGAKEMSAAIEPAVLSFAGLNRGAVTTVFQLPDYVLDLHSGTANPEKPLGNRILWMANQSVQTAELRVNPPQLGPVEVRISVEGDQANVSLITQHTVVREIMESAIPRLRDMLAESGLNLANIDVSQHDLSQQKRDTSSFLSAWQEEHNPTENLANGNSELKNLHSSSIGLGLIDFYA